MNRQFPERTTPNYKAIVIAQANLCAYALQKLIESHPQIESSVSILTIEEARENMGFLAQNIRENSIVFLEFGLCGRSEPESLYRAFRGLSKNCEVVLILDNLDFFTISKCGELGASNIIWRDDSIDVYENSLRAAFVKSSFVSAVVARKMKMVAAQEKWLRDTSVSPREKDVLIRLGVGLSPKEIGHEFSLSSKTISTYRTRLMQKLQLRNNAEICYFCIQHFPELVRCFVECEAISIPKAYSTPSDDYNFMNPPNHSLQGSPKRSGEARSQIPPHGESQATRISGKANDVRH